MLFHRDAPSAHLVCAALVCLACEMPIPRSDEAIDAAARADARSPLEPADDSGAADERDAATERDATTARDATPTTRDASTVVEGLPSWVPPPGEVAVLTHSNGRLTNHFRDIVAPYYEPFYSVKVVNDYSSYFVNPYFGDYGALIGFGGGHAATNDNMVWALEIGRDTCTFRRLIDPTPLFGSGTDPDTRYQNSVGSVFTLLDRTYGEYLTDRQPASPHTYASGDVLGPDEGGAASGTFLRVLSGALGHVGDSGVAAAHQVAFDGTEGPFEWERRTDEATVAGTSLAGMHWTAHVASQDRIYIEARGATAVVSPRWFDLRENRYVTGTGTPRLNDAPDSDTGILFHVPSRQLLVMADRDGAGRLRLQYLDVSEDDPDWTTSVTLSEPLDVVEFFQCAAWCPDNERILVGCASGDDEAVHEIEIPASLSDPWPITRAPFGAGQSIDFVGSPTYKKWSYSPRIRAILYMPRAATEGDETVWVYRPRGT